MSTSRPPKILGNRSFAMLITKKALAPSSSFVPLHPLSKHVLSGRHSCRLLKAMASDLQETPQKGVKVRLINLKGIRSEPSKQVALQVRPQKTLGSVFRTCLYPALRGSPEASNSEQFDSYPERSVEKLQDSKEVNQNNSASRSLVTYFLNRMLESPSHRTANCDVLVFSCSAALWHGGSAPFLPKEIPLQAML